MAIAPSPVFLQGSGIYLRALTEADCDGPYLSWFNDAEVCRFNGHHRFPYTRAAALSYVNQVSGSPDDLVLAMVEADSNRHVGNVSLLGLDYVSRNAEFAIVIGERDCWNKGYGKQAARLLLDHGFLTLDLHRVYCGTAADNLAMRKMAVSLGMREEGCRREALYKRGQCIDIIDYGVLKQEYLQRFGMK
jgi:ribosomal-protein-alanine N-acetyltransferase